MGTINYGTSKYITIGLEPFDYDDFKFYNPERGEYVTDFDELNFAYEDAYNDIAEILNNYDFNYFDVKICNGYYEGFYIDIRSSEYEYFDDYNEKRNALKETTQLKKFLLECINNGLCEVWPGWRTSYKNAAESKKSILDATFCMRRDIKETPTWAQYNKNGGVA